MFESHRNAGLKTVSKAEGMVGARGEAGLSATLYNGGPLGPCPELDAFESQP